MILELYKDLFFVAFLGLKRFSSFLFGQIQYICTVQLIEKFLMKINYSPCKMYNYLTLTM